MAQPWETPSLAGARASRGCLPAPYEHVPDPFEGDKLIRLAPCYLFNIAMSGAIFGWLEANVIAAHGQSAGERKNNTVWTSVPPDITKGTGTTQAFVQLLYAFYKTDAAINAKAVGANPWLMKSRLYQLSMKHVPLHKLLWTVFGPAQLLAKRHKVVSKLEAGGFAGFEMLEHWKPRLQAEKAAVAEKATEAAKARRKCVAPLMQCVAQCMPKVAQP